MLSRYYPHEYVESVFALDYGKLYEKGFRGIIFDIDNTLVHHGDDSTPEIDALFRELHGLGLKTALLTNNDEERVTRFIENIDTLYVCDAEKPDTAGYRQAIELLGIKDEEALFVGDQVFTDIAGANKSGLANVLVKFIQLEGETRIGKKRYLEYAILWFWKRSKKHRHRLGDICKDGRGSHAPTREARGAKEKKLFCEISPTTYAISTRKEICVRHISDLLGKDRFAGSKVREKLPHVVSSHHSQVIKKGKGIDPRLQENKEVNIKLASEKINGTIIRPGEVFSFWRTVGKVTKGKGYLDGRVIIGDRIQPGLGGGLCNLGNTVNLLVLHSPLDVTEMHTHSDALAPDSGERIPFSSGTSVCYNYIDYRCKNNTDQDIQLLIWCEDGMLCGELRSEAEFPQRYELIEEGHHFRREDGKYYRVSKIYRHVIDKASGKIADKQLIRDNRSEVMFDYDLIPAELIR